MLSDKEYFSGKTILVTGASGFVGVHLIEYLKQLHCSIRVITRKKIEFCDNHFCDFPSDNLDPIVLEKVDIVIHLAGYAHDTSNKENVQKYININTNFTTELAQLASLAKVKKFIYISSVKAGGKPKSGLDNTEINQSEPEGNYGLSKRNAELNLLAISKESEMAVSIIRPALVYGPNLKGNLKLMYEGIKSGWFPPVPQTNNRRSLIHVDDLVLSILFIAKQQKSEREIYIVTDNNFYSTRDLYKTFCKLQGRKLPTWVIPLFLFKLVGLINGRLDHKINKLLGDEGYSSNKISELGFTPKKSFSDMDRSDLIEIKKN